jgi:hypothetical protein
MKIGGVANGTSGIWKVKGVVPHDHGMGMVCGLQSGWTTWISLIEMVMV